MQGAAGWRGRAGQALPWIVGVGAMAAWGGRRGRRAATRGALAALLARPAARAARAPSAGALAFVAGVAVEQPLMASGAAAVLLGPSWRHTRRDWATSVAVAVPAALATLRAMPRVPRLPSVAPAVPLSGREEPSADGAGLVIVANPAAGSGRSGAVLEELRAELPAAEVVELGPDDDPAEALRDAAARGRVLAAVGGDGTITSAAEAALAAGKPLLAVPGGTLNHFCHALGLETAADAVAAIRDGGCVQVDVATIDGAPFLNTASFGAYPELVDHRERLEGRIGKWPAMAVALAQVLRHATPMDVELDGRPARLWMVFLGNGRYEPPGFAPTWRTHLDEGVLDVRVVDATHPFARTRLVLAVLTGRLGRTAVYREWTTRRLEVRCASGALRLARDGETFEGSDHVVVVAGSRTLKVFAPPR